MQENYPTSVLTICTAAVSDFTPVDAEDKKLKKTSMTGTMSLQLEQTPDILAALGAAKKPNQKLVGFALETNNGEDYAKEKLVRKNADAIILNMLSSKTGFESNTNAVDIFFQDGGELSFELMDKSLLGKQLLEALIEKFQ